jgi:nicotinamide riboside transporter PnuC
MNPFSYVIQWLVCIVVTILSYIAVAYISQKIEEDKVGFFSGCMGILFIILHLWVYVMGVRTILLWIFTNQ